FTPYRGLILMPAPVSCESTISGSNPIDHSPGVRNEARSNTPAFAGWIMLRVANKRLPRIHAIVFFIYIKVQGISIPNARVDSLPNFEYKRYSAFWMVA